MTERDLSELKDLVERGDLPTHKLAGVATERDASMLTWMEQNYTGRGSWSNTEQGQQIVGSVLDRSIRKAAHNGRLELAAYLVGLTEIELTASEFSFSLELLTRIRNNQQPLMLLVLGDPNSGKTGHVFSDWFEAWRALHSDGLLVTNADVAVADYVIDGLNDLYEFCTEHSDRQKFVFIDEGSTHFDARTNAHVTAAQFTPLAKRFAKLQVDFATCGHTTMDIHPELKRLATTIAYKPELKRVQFYDDIDEDELLNPVFPDPIDGLDSPRIDYDPDDWAPLRFDLDSDRLRERHDI